MILLLSTTGLALSILFYNSTVTPFDRPFILSHTTETIIATRVDWMCHCANFVDTTMYKTNPATEPSDDDYFFIESDSASQLDRDYFSKNEYIKLTGQFYIDKGIPEEYKLGHIEDKPDHARVFKVDKIE
ncbi:MAG: hypothetical protein JSS79_20035 [Bacteroidetes bacterium]|nr:hypothetical protein [Bacteroidota bacterium]